MGRCSLKLSCFLIGTVFVILCLPARHGLVRLRPALLGLLAGGLGLVGVLGYLLGIPTAYQWQPFTDSVVLSAVGECHPALSGVHGTAPGGRGEPVRGLGAGRGPLTPL
jgi:hypothetical protein